MDLAQPGAFRAPKAGQRVSLKQLQASCGSVPQQPLLARGP